MSSTVVIVAFAELTCSIESAWPNRTGMARRARTVANYVTGQYRLDCQPDFRFVWLNVILVVLTIASVVRDVRRYHCITAIAQRMVVNERLSIEKRMDRRCHETALASGFH